MRFPETSFILHSSHESSSEQAIESRATRQITERRGRVLTSNSQNVLVLYPALSYAVYSTGGRKWERRIVAYDEHAFEKYDSRWDPMRISIPWNINDRVSMGTRNKSNGSLFFPGNDPVHLASAPRVRPSRPPHGRTVGAQRCRDPLSHLFYFHFLQYIFVNTGKKRDR